MSTALSEPWDARLGAMTDEGKPSPVRPLPSWVPPGWYPDPLGQGAARHWDGKRWTLEYRDDPPPEPIPTSPDEIPARPSESSGAVSSAPSASQPGIRDRWNEASTGVRIALVGGGIILLLIVIGAIAGGGKSKTAAGNASGASGAAVGPSAQVTAPPITLTPDRGSYAVTSSHTTLHGTVATGAAVSVEGHSAHIHGTHWSATVPLTIGPNTISVEATLAGHEPTSTRVSVTRHHTQGELEAKQHAREEAQRTREREAAERVEHYKAEAVTIPYNQLNKNPEEYVGKIVKYRGQIFQIQEEAGEGFMLLAVDEEYEVWTDNIWVNFEHHVNAAKEAIVTVYGEITGAKSYKTQIGGETYVPEMKAKYVEE